ncbi:hypothetical protein EV668_3027 [Enterovirga rhinocerotis]|uniref:Spermidine synthase n=1 Tax=Enterovirga rhinocerotis TaxID=1339210 RepID=A0A4R7BZI7_9HYPH|nr:hypothetical protein EV668_3027 [Enterovirga rhinocerotis]
MPVFVATIGLSAFLLFAVQPLFAKLVLPILGGSPSVWSVATVVFQCLLLAGYAYAHGLGAMPIRRAVPIHLALTGAASLTLPIALSPGWTSAPAGYEIPWLAGLMLVSLGLPFFALAANGPLLQSWFSRTGHAQAGDPYFLYAASNIGSFAALASYPLLIEPTLRLRDQLQGWSAGFVLLIGLIAACGFLAMRGPAAAPRLEEEARHRAGLGRWLAWIGLAAIPSGLLVAVTAHISTDIAPMPLLWTLPLGLYLLSFVVAFRPGQILDHDRLTLIRIGLATLTLLALGQPTSLGVGLALHLGFFTLTALACHRLLYRLRPPAGGLTGFYLALSVGGAIGGLFCGMLAPLVFDTLAEYPLLVVASLLCRSDWRDQAPPRKALVQGAAALALCLGAIAASLLAPKLGAPAGASSKLPFLAAAIVAILWWRSVAASVVAAATIALLATHPGLIGGTPGESIRSFFGIHRIETTTDGRFRVLSHGTTIHGAIQLRGEDGSETVGRPEPTTYYTFEGVIGRAIASVRTARGGRIGSASLVGLGTGSLACHRREGEAWTFYEIDRSVIDIARDPARFRFLRDCGEMPIVLGDARLTLASAPAGQDLVLLDAFSSDSIPVHLLTREAIGLYLSRLGPHGVIVLHISNRHLDLRRILVRTAAEHGLVALVGTDETDEPAARRMRSRARIVVLARTLSDLGPIATDPLFTPLAPEPGRRPWTDDFSNVVEALLDARKP